MPLVLVLTITAVKDATDDYVSCHLPLSLVTSPSHPPSNPQSYFYSGQVLDDFDGPHGPDGCVVPRLRVRQAVRESWFRDALLFQVWGETVSYFP